MIDNQTAELKELPFVAAYPQIIVFDTRCHLLMISSKIITRVDLILIRRMFTDTEQILQR